MFNSKTSFQGEFLSEEKSDTQERKAAREILDKTERRVLASEGIRSFSEEAKHFLSLLSKWRFGGKIRNLKKILKQTKVIGF